MGKNSCTCRCNCIALAAIASFIIGIITAALTFTTTIIITPAFLWVALSIAIVYLAVLLASSSALPARDCICSTVTAVLTGILGTALSAIILLGVGFAATSILGAIITGVLLFFLSLTVTTTACLIKCAFGCTDYDD